MGKYIIAFSDVQAAAKRIRQHVHYTPMFSCTTLDNLSGRNIFFKAENLQKTGSFKFRGAINAISLMCAEKRECKCVVTHSSGNHGQAIAKAAQVFNIPAYIIMPKTSPQCKKNAVMGYGGIIVECEPTEQDRINKCEEIIKKVNGYFIHANQTDMVIAGQGTLAIEMLEQNPDLNAIVAPVGGGGMISGIAIAAKQIKPSIKVYAAEPELANDCYLSKFNGYRTPLQNTPSTIADGVKVNIGEHTWPIIKDLVDGVITVSEEEIKNAIKLVWERAKLVIEPTSGVGVAAVLGNKFSILPKDKENINKVGIVLCGGNVDLGSISTLFS